MDIVPFLFSWAEKVRTLAAVAPAILLALLILFVLWLAYFTLHTTGNTRHTRRL